MTDYATEHFDIVVVGAGPAGTAAALRARELGAKVGPYPRIVDTGCDYAASYSVAV